MRIALATAPAYTPYDEDAPLLLDALEGSSLQAWDDPDVDWDAFDLVVLRSTWDYTLRLEEFLVWTRSVPRLRNTADVVAWNTDKTYLRELAAAGLSVIDTAWFVPGDTVSVPEGAYVVKPTVSAGARDTAVFTGAAGVAAADVLLAAGRPVMVQPYVDGVDSEGETSVVVVEGAVSHGARKAAVLKEGGDLRSHISPREPSPEQVHIALSVVDLARRLTGSELLYARVDLVPGPSGPQLMELELTEPSLFLRHAPGSAQRFAAAVARAATTARPTGGPTPQS